MADTTEERELRDLPTGELLKRLADETGTLVRQEMRLARAELTEKGRKAGVGAGLLTAATVAGLLALGAFTAFLVLALDGAMPNWGAALVVAAGYAVAGAVLGLAGRERIREAGGPMPEKTEASIEEDLRWARNQARSGRR